MALGLCPRKEVSPTQHGSRAHPMGHVGGNSYGWGASTGLAPKDCLFYIGPDPGGAGSVKRLLGELTLKIHSSQNSQGLPHTSSKKETETVKEKL